VSGLPPVTPRPAASLLLVREPNLVYMTARPASLRVGAGFYVFPGGAVEPQDHEYAAQRPGELQAAGLPADQRAFAAAAIRETFEEVGLLLAYDGAGRPLWRPEGAAPHVETLRAVRAQLHAGETTLLAAAGACGWRLAGERLGYVVRWVTPPAAPLRFDTRFFVADATGSAEPAPFAPEVSVGCWLPVEEALAREAAGELPLMRPTKALLEKLASLGGARAAVRAFQDASWPREEVLEPNTPETLLAVLSGQGVAVAPVPSPASPAGEANVYLISHGGEAVLVDAGPAGDESAARVCDLWRRRGRPAVKALLLTHAHPGHAGGAPALRQRFGCPVRAHVSALEALRERYGLDVDQPLFGGETISVGALHLDVIHAPGHSPDHLCFFLRERAVLFTGDNAGGGSSRAGPPGGHMEQYLQTLSRLKEVPARILAPGHGPLLDEPAARIEALIRELAAAGSGGLSDGLAEPVS